MTEIDHKVDIVKKYIFIKKNINIGNIKLKNGLDLQKLNHAYKIAIKFFRYGM